MTGSTRSKRVVEDCSRCGRPDRPGHSCERRWAVPRWLRFGSLYPLGLGYSAFKRSDGSLSDGYWSLHWRWGGDTHQFTIRPSLGSHYNHSERARLERLNRDFELTWDDDEGDTP